MHPEEQRTDNPVRYGPHAFTLPGPRGHKPPFAQDSPHLHVSPPFDSQRCLHLDKKIGDILLLAASALFFFFSAYFPYYTNTRPFCLPHQNEVRRQGPCQVQLNSSDLQQASDNTPAKLNLMLTEES